MKKKILRTTLSYQRPVGNAPLIKGMGLPVAVDKKAVNPMPGSHHLLGRVRRGTRKPPRLGK